MHSSSKARRGSRLRGRGTEWIFNAVDALEARMMLCDSGCLDESKLAPQSTVPVAATLLAPAPALTLTLTLTPAPTLAPVSPKTSEEEVKVDDKEAKFHGNKNKLPKVQAPLSKADTDTSFTNLAGFGAGTNVNISKRTGYQGEGTIAIDPTNPNRLFAASNLAGSGLFAAYSTDAGQTWTTRTMASGSDGLPVACCDASSSWDQFGNLFVGYIQTNVNPAKTVLVRSSDGGQTFSLVTTFSASDQPTVTTGPGNVAGSGSVWLSWVSNTGNQLVASGAQVTALGTIGSFISPESTPSTTGNFGDIAIGPGGAVMVTYQDNTGGQGLSNLRVNVDSDGVGANGFAATVTPTTTNVGGFDFIPAQSRRSVDAEAGLAWDHSGGPHNGRVYLMYTSESPDESNDMDINVRISDNNGATWSAPVRVNDDATTRTQMLPRIALDQSSGNVAITWLDARNDAGAGGAGDTNGVANDDVQLWGTLSTDSGTTWQPNMQISAGTSRAGAQSNSNDFGDYTGLAFVGGAFYPIWPDNSTALGGNPDLPNFDMATARLTVGPSVPTNDNFASRINLGNSTSASTAGSNANGTKESGEPNIAGNAGGSSVWWSWTAPTSQSYVITTAGSNFNTLLGVYTGSAVNSLTQTIANDDENNPSILTSRVTFNAVAGTTYQIAVDGFNGATGNIALGISLAQHTISGAVFVDRNSNGVIDSGEPLPGGRSVFLDTNNDGSFQSGSSSPSSTDVPKNIADLSTVTSNLIVSGFGGAVTDVNVTLNITHTFDSDLTVFLISPTGTRVQLFAGVGGSGDNFTNTTLDDEAAGSITTGTAPFGGSFKPQGLLSGVDGQSPNGTWQLEVNDTASGDVGTLNSWSLAIGFAEPSTTTNGSGAYTFSGLPSGTYNIRQVQVAGFLQTSPSPSTAARTIVAQLGQPTTGQNFGNFPLSFAGSVNNDTYALSTLVGGTTLQILETLGASPLVTYQIPKATLGSSTLTFTGNTGDDAFALDYTNGAPLPTNGITINGSGQTTADTLTITGSAAGDALSIGTGGITFGSTISYSGIETIMINTAGGDDTLTQSSQPGGTLVFNGGASTTADTLTINAGSIAFNSDAGIGTTALNLNVNAAGTSATFNATQHLNNLSIVSGANADMSANGSRVLVTSGLTIVGSAQLNLRDNDMIVKYTASSPLGTWNGTAYTGITGLLASGNNNGAWNGAGIATTSAGGDLTGLAVGESADIFGLGGTQTASFDGETVDSKAVLVKFTYTGDANLDGVINGDDYFQVDSAFPQGLHGYFNGDFNYDGVINGDDYFLIDSNFPAQTGAL